MKSLDGEKKVSNGKPKNTFNENSGGDDWQFRRLNLPKRCGCTDIDSIDKEGVESNPCTLQVEYYLYIPPPLHTLLWF